MTYETLEMIERARRRLKESASRTDRDLECSIAGGASDDAITAAEEALGCTFPPSYRAFLRRYGAVTLPGGLSTISRFLGIGGGDSVTDRTLLARDQHRLGKSLVIVATGAEPGEWFCLDIDRTRSDGECPVMLFDARDNQLDQQFYEDFGQMVHEVVTFLLETVDADEDDVESVPRGERGASSAY